MVLSIASIKSALLDISEDPVIIARVCEESAKAKVSYANDALLRLIGRNVDDCAGQCLERLLKHTIGVDFNFGKLLETENAGVEKATTIVQPNGAAVDYRVTVVVKRDGHERYVCVNFRPVQAIGSTILKTLANERDEAIAKAEHLASAIEAFPTPFVIYDKELKLLHWNTSYEAAMTVGTTCLKKGMSLRDVLKLAVESEVYKIAPGGTKDWIDDILSEDNLASRTQDIEFGNDNHYRLFRYRSTNDDYVVVRIDSTELVRERRKAESTQSRLLAALNAYPSPFVIYDANDCIVVWNDAYDRSMSNADEPIQVGMHRNEVANVALRAGKLFKVVDQDVQKPIQDLELPGDIHQQLHRSRVSNGDLVIVRIDTTELVRERRAVEKYAQELEIANQEISHQATHDDLTGLGNRRKLKSTFEEFEMRRNRYGGEIAALHIDLDRFKQINDTMGHAAGDQVLLDVSKRISASVNADEVVARIGGDEFVVLCYVTDDCERPMTLANELLEVLSKPSRIEGKEHRFGASIGMAITPLTNVDQLLTNSDVALYKAKGSGRGRLAVFDASDLEQLHQQKALTDEVLRSIEDRDFIPFYQPQVDAQTQKIVGLEILARWNHPTNGILPPAAFLSVVADLNATADIDKMVFERAVEECTFAFSGLADLPSLSFNASAARIIDHDIDEIQHVAQTYPGRVTFELLETIFMEEAEEAFFAKLDQLRSLGIEIEVDDFGSGRASVVALQRINPDRIKIDRRLVSHIDSNAESLRLLRSLIEIGRALKMGVIAEGVETKRQAEILAELGCDRLQGYYFSRPFALDGILPQLGLALPRMQARHAG